MSVEKENHHHRPRTLSLTATAEHGHDVLSQQHQQQQQHTPLVLWPKNFHPKDSSTPGQTSSGTGSCICRICHSGETSVLSINGGHKCERLISPCNCSGSVGLVHKSCLEKWLSVSEEIKCELCGFDFSVRTKGKLLLFFNRVSPRDSPVNRNSLCNDSFTWMMNGFYLQRRSLSSDSCCSSSSEGDEVKKITILDPLK